METMDLIFTKYWNQILIIIGVFIIGLKYILEKRKRKDEIFEEIFRTGKIKAIENFLDVYADQNSFWIEIPYFPIIEGKLKGEEIDKLVRPGLNRLEKAFYKLSIYLNKDEFDSYISLLDNIKSINTQLSESYRNYNFFNKKDIIQTNDFHYMQQEKLKENEVILKEISNNFQLNFKK